MIRRAVYKLSESERVRGIASRAADKGIMFVLDPGPGNTQNIMNIKKNLKNAYVLYKTHDSKNFNKGRNVGKKLSNSLFRLYEIQANKQKYTTNTLFMKGLKNGVRQSVLYWVPGVYMRSVKRKFEYNTNRFMKRAQHVKGVENIHRLFSNDNNKNVHRSNSTKTSVR